MPQTIQVIGVEQAIANFQQLPLKVQNKQLRFAMSAGLGEIKRAVVANAPRETGALSKSQVVKVTIPNASWDTRHHGKPAYGMVGAKRGFVMPAVRKGRSFKSVSIRKATKRVLGGGKVYTRRPSRYSHLAERRHRFMARASQTAGPRATERIVEKLKQGFETEAASLPK